MLSFVPGLDDEIDFINKEIHQLSYNLNCEKTKILCETFKKIKLFLMDSQKKEAAKIELIQKLPLLYLMRGEMRNEK